MNISTSKLFVLFIITFGLSCEPTENENGQHDLRGVVVSSDGFVQDATIVIKRGAIEQSRLTDAEGKFYFERIVPGEYMMTVRSQSEDQNFIQLQKNVSVNASTDEQTIVLPEGTTLHEPSEVTATSVKLSWSKSGISDFLEYKLYRHSSSGLDENTGTLVHVAMDVSDTVFTDQGLEDKQTYFYRVFVRNSFGLYGGSNIREVKTSSRNHIHNGNLENGITNWEIFSPDPCGSVVQDPTAPVNSAVFKFQISSNATANISAEVFQNVSHTELKSGQTYKLSFSARAESLPGTSVFYVYLMANENYNHVVSLSVDNTATRDWSVYSKDFIAPEATEPYSLFLYLEPPIPYNNELVEVYVDDISIVRQ